MTDVGNQWVLSLVTSLATMAQDDEGLVMRATDRVLGAIQNGRMEPPTQRDHLVSSMKMRSSA